MSGSESGTAQTQRYFNGWSRSGPKSFEKFGWGKGWLRLASGLSADAKAAHVMVHPAHRQSRRGVRFRGPGRLAPDSFSASTNTTARCSPNSGKRPEPLSFLDEATPLLEISDFSGGSSGFHIEVGSFGFPVVADLGEESSGRPQGRVWAVADRHGSASAGARGAAGRARD